MISQEIINRMGVTRGMNTFPNDNGKINRRQQDRCREGGCHRRWANQRPGVNTRATSINLQWSR